MKLTAGLLCGLALLTACGEEEVQSGRIVDRAFHPAHTITDMEPTYTTQCTTDSKGNMTCHQVLVGYHSVRRHFNDKWTITVEKCATDHCARRDVSVTQADFDRVNVGDDHWDAKKGISS